MLLLILTKINKLEVRMNRILFLVPLFFVGCATRNTTEVPATIVLNLFGKVEFTQEQSLEGTVENATTTDDITASTDLTAPINGVEIPELP